MQETNKGAKIFGVNLFGSEKEDDKSPEKAYNIIDLKSAVQFHYLKEHYSMYDFHEKTMKEIREVNTSMGDDIIVTRGVSLMPYLPEDVIYKFLITCYNQTWR